MPGSLIRGDTQVQRWFRCSDGRLCLELLLQGGKRPLPVKTYFTREQVVGVLNDYEVISLTEARKIWPHAF